MFNSIIYLLKHSVNSPIIREYRRQGLRSVCLVIRSVHVLKCPLIREFIVHVMQPYTDSYTLTSGIIGKFLYFNIFSVQVSHTLTIPYWNKTTTTIITTTRKYHSTTTTTTPTTQATTTTGMKSNSIEK